LAVDGLAVTYGPGTARRGLGGATRPGRGGAPIGAGRVMTPPPHFSRQRGMGGHNLGIIH